MESDIKSYVFKNSLGVTDLSGDKKMDEKYVEKLVADGVYGAEDNITFHLKPNPIFDIPKSKEFHNRPAAPLESHKLMFIDMTEYNKK
jgi:hypothetical protein